jgi:hypothetical protein
MDLRRGSVIALLAVGAATACFAQRPSIIINSDPPDPTIITGLSFTFSADAGGGGDFSFVNDSGQNWFSMNVLVNLPGLETITCGPGPFGTCSVTPSEGPDNTFNYDISFGPSPAGAIAQDQGFSIDLNDNGLTNTDPNGNGDWGPDTTFDATVNSVPEPATSGFCVLALAGGLGMVWRKKFAKRRHQTPEIPN